MLYTGYSHFGIVFIQYFASRCPTTSPYNPDQLREICLDIAEILHLINVAIVSLLVTKLGFSKDYFLALISLEKQLLVAPIKTPEKPGSSRSEASPL